MARVIRMDPGHSAYLLWADSIGRYAILPHQHADRQYKVRDSLMGAVYKVGDEFPMLSQRSMHYFRRIAELVLAPVLADDHVHIKRVATAQAAPFVKVAVDTYRSGEDVIAACKPLLYEFRTYTSRTIALVKYHSELESYIREALAPAPSRSVRRVDVYREEHRARVIVERGTIAQFLGRKGMNAAVASKLTGYGLVLVDEADLGKAAGA
ncbi:MAG: hypothetical protein H8K05_07805 [Nitrospira sp.]|nr:hypothetical protein [Nitrospira sp.]